MSSIHPTVSVVVSTKDRANKIGGFLRSAVLLSRQDLEIVVVDQSRDDATERLTENFLGDHRLKYVRSESLGVSAGRNLGVALSRGGIVCITDDDCILGADWADRMYEAFSDPHIGLAWCGVVPLEAVGFTPQRVFPKNHTVTDVAEAWRRAESGFNLGAGMAVRRAAFDDIGGFDELLGPGAAFPAAEDNDVAWRMLIKGWWVRELADVTVVHDGRRDGEESRALMRRDALGIGGTSAKYLRTGHWRVVRLLLVRSIRGGFFGPARDIVRRRRPRGFRGVWWTWEGMLEARRYAIDKSTLCYVSQPKLRVR